MKTGHRHEAPLPCALVEGRGKGSAGLDPPAMLSVLMVNANLALQSPVKGTVGCANRTFFRTRSGFPGQRRGLKHVETSPGAASPFRSGAASQGDVGELDPENINLSAAAGNQKAPKCRATHPKQSPGGGVPQGYPFPPPLLFLPRPRGEGAASKGEGRASLASLEQRK